MQRHKFDIVSFILGALTLVIGGVMVSGMHGVHWLAPVFIIGVGTAFVGAAVQRALVKDDETSSGEQS